MDVMGIILPIAAFLIAGLLVVALWLWWSGSGSPQDITTDPSVISSADIASKQPFASQPSNLLQGALIVLPSTIPGKVLVQVDGETYQHIGEIRDMTIRDRVRLQIQALHMFAGESHQDVAPSSPVPTPPRVQPTLAEPETTTEDTVAGQIEAILQEQLLLAPQMQGRSIHILHAPDGGVQIKVDAAYYESVNDVSDEDIRAILQEAIKEWEMRTQLS